MPSYPVPAESAALPDVVRAVRNLYRGKMNVAGTVTLAADAEATVLRHPAIGPASHIGLTPLTATAAAAAPWIASQGGGEALLAHAADAATDRTFAYAVIG